MSEAAATPALGSNDSVPHSFRRPTRAEWLWLIAAVAYAVVFLARQATEIGNPHRVEWDARGTSLPAWRFHGTGLFPDDLVVDFVAASYATPLWDALFWVGTLFTDPLTLTQVLPYLPFAVVLWHGTAFSWRRAGPLAGALALFLLVHSFCIWARVIGVNSRAFGFPLVLMFSRYVAERRDRAALMTILAMAVAYPSILVLSGPAYGLVLLARRDRRGLLRLAAAGAIALVLAGKTMWITDPRIGKPPTLAQAAGLRQMQRGGYQPFHPLPPALESFAFTFGLAFETSGQPLVPAVSEAAQRHRVVVGLGFILALLVASGRGARAAPSIAPALVLSGFLGFALISVLAYRLYLPDRPLTFAFPIALVMTVPCLTLAAAARVARSWVPHAAISAVASFFLLVGGNGLPRLGNVFDWSRGHTPAVDFVGTLPPGVMVAAHPEVASHVQTYARRRVLFSSTTNTPFYYAYAREMEARMEGFFRAYYAPSLEEVRRFARERRVDYLILDRRDFGPTAIERSRYYEPWTTLNRGLLTVTPGPTCALARPPATAIVFGSSEQVVLDLSRL